MTDKINELKALIEALDAASPLRSSLEKALQEELRRQTETDDALESDTQIEDTDEEDEDNGEDEDNTPVPSTGILSGLTDKLDDLLDNDEFIAASAGFLIGAMTVGAGALAISALKK